jgi:Ca2+-binding EF-hand superfamily protein
VRLSILFLLLCTTPHALAQVERFAVGTGSRPATVELRITIDGKPAGKVWEAYLDNLFRHLDLDGDGWLNKAEAARAPSAAFLASFLEGSLNLDAAASAIPFDELDTTRRGKVNRLDFGRYYKRAQLGRPRLRAGPIREQAVALTQALFHLLSPGRDGLTLTDLARAREVLLRVDWNCDEWITPDEILLVSPDSTGATRSHAPLTTLGVKRVDDGTTHTAMIFSMQLGRPGRAEAAVTAGAGGSSGTRLPDGGVRLKVEGGELDIKVGMGTVSRTLGMHAFFRQQFQAADGGGRGYVEFRQLDEYPALAGLFRLADRDGDRRLTSQEFESFLTLHAEGARSTVTVTAMDQSPGLFELMDENGDGRLSLRELYTAGQRLRGLFPPGNGRLQAQGLPRRLELRVTLGGSTPGNEKTAQAEAPRQPVQGPAWFKRMDRNRDGYVSFREFLGRLEDFQKLDLDGDGLISPEEAAKAVPAPKDRQ